MSQNNIPFQVESLIDNMLNNKEDVYIRENYRARLDMIRAVINKSIERFDQERFLQKADIKTKKRAPKGIAV